MIEPKNCWINECKDNPKCKQSNFCMKLFKLDYLYNQALLTPTQRKHLDLRIDSDGTDRDIFIELKNIENNIQSFVNSGKNLYLHSVNTGCGKTSWALRFIQAYFNTIWPRCDLTCKALFINVPRFFLALKDNISHQSEYIQHIKQNVLLADLVIWDEVGVKGLTEYEHENLLNLINARIDDNKSNIYTSNLSPEELHEKVGDRLYSRIVNNSINIEFKGVDKRGI